MKHLILIRHAETEQKVTGMTDMGRELTTGGIRQAANAGSFLREHSVNVDIIFCSPALRTETTAHLVAEQLHPGTEIIHMMDALYQASVGTLFSLIRDADQHQCIAIVGHNPELSYFSEFLTGTTVEELRPGNVLIFRLDIGNWKEIQKGNAILLDRFEA